MTTDKRAGFVYLLTNPSINGKVKIGRVESDDLQKLKARIRALSSHAGVPEKFELRYAVRVDDVDKAETLLHEAFGWVRKNKNREFFDIAPEKVEAAMKLTLVGGSDRVPVALVDAYHLSKELTPPLDPDEHGFFARLQIPPGKELTFKGDSSLKVIVVGKDNKVRFGSKDVSFRAAAKKIRERKGLTLNFSAPRDWVYEKETLDVRKQRMGIK